MVVREDAREGLTAHNPESETSMLRKLVAVAAVVGLSLAALAPDTQAQTPEMQKAAEFFSTAGNPVGFASAVHYVHPDKPAELWINEVGVSPRHRRLGIARSLLRELLVLGRRIGCQEAWVLTERENDAATGLYRSLGGAEFEGDTVGFSFSLG